MWIEFIFFIIFLLFGMIFLFWQREDEKYEKMDLLKKMYFYKEIASMFLAALISLIIGIIRFF